MKTKFKKMATICITMASLITSTCGGFGNLTNVSAADIINTGDYVLESALDPNMVADVENAGTTNECNLWLYERNNTSAQKFSIESAGNGYYTIKMAVTDGMVLDVYGGTGYQGCNVQIYQSKDTSNDNQLWSFEDAGDGYVYIKSKTGYYLDVSGGFTDNQTNIHVWTGNGTDAQRWKLVRCNEPDILKVTASQNVTTAFSDVKAGMWYVDAIQYVYDKGYMTGKVRPTQSTKGYFDISGTITKAEFATVLYNIAGKSPIDYYGFFSDVPDGQWFTKPALFSYYYGIVEFDDSLNNSIYDLNEKLTREKVAMMLYGYVKAFKDQKGYDTSIITGASNGYIDSNSISSNAKEAMDWAVTQHIIKGKGNANDTKDKLLLDPTASITRAECAQVIKNFLAPESVSPSPLDYEKAYFPGTVLKVTQGAYKEFNRYSHDSQNAFDLSGNSNYVAPFTGKIVSIYNNYNVVTLQSTDKVYYADGTLDYMTVSFVHDNDISDLCVGQTIKQGTVFYQPGVKDPTGKTTGAHLHIAVKRGRVANYFFSGDVYPNDAFWLKENTTINQRGGYAWSSTGSTTTLENGAVYTIQPYDMSLYLSEAGTENLANVRLSNTVTNDSKWRAYITESGWYFQNLASNKVLDINGQSVNSGSNVQIYTYNKCATEYFTLKPNGSGAFIIQTTNKRVAIDCKGSYSTLQNGSNVWCYDINYDTTQLFRFNRVG